jgi:8-oxo-dGTP pyrophosphatase MutT (NUDIX family)
MRDTTLEEVRRILSGRTPRTLVAPSLRPAGVLLLLYLKDGEYYINFNVRTGRVEHHKGEISFPGGGKNPSDPTLLATALRETHEEIGVDPQHVEVLGTLDQDSTRTGFLVAPFVGTIPSPYSFRPSRIEVAEVLEVPVSHLLNPSFTLPREQSVGGELIRYRDYEYNGNVIFGLTARILTGFLDLAGHVLAPGVGGSRGIG